VTSTQASVEAELTLSVPRYKKCAALDVVCALGGLVGTLLSTLGGSWGSDGSSVLTFKLVLNGVNATARITGVQACEPSPDVRVSATTSATSGSLRLDLLSPLLTTQTTVPQAASSTATHAFTQSPSTWSHVGGIGTQLVGPIVLDSLLTNVAKTSAVVLNLSSAGIDLGSKLSTGLNSALSGLGLSLNGASVTLDTMSTCSVFGLRK
jgi:hypothetical protein